MKLAITAALCLVSCCAMAEEAAPASTNRPPTAGELLDSVVAQMPDKPVIITGRLGVRDRSPRTIRAYDVEMQVRFRKDSVSGTYTLFDASGATLERFTVMREAGKKPVYEYSTGNPLKPAAAPDTSDWIRDTGATWSDLTFPFLWWRDGRIVGDESIRGEDCYVILVTPPRGEAKPGLTVKVWIDKRHRVMLRAEEWDADGKMLRRLVVDSFKKINDEWMIKDILVEGAAVLPPRYKSFLTIQDMQLLGKPEEATAPQE